MKSQEQRIDPRFDDFGRVDASSLCVFPGVLVDVSKVGIKVRFQTVVDVDLDVEYEVKITPTRKEFGQLVLVCKPMWNKNDDISTEIGFSILHSPSTKQFLSYVEVLKQSAKDYSIDDYLVGSSCQ